MHTHICPSWLLFRAGSRHVYMICFAFSNVYRCNIYRFSEIHMRRVCLLKGVAEGTYKAKRAEAASLYYTTIECVLLLQNVFSYLECVLLL